MITFIIPTKNSYATIGKCLNSCKEYPVIVVDKNSTDGTLERIKEYKNVKLIHQKGDGIADARNQALKHVETKYVCNLGSDNVIYNNRWTITRTNHIEDLIKYMEFRNWVGVGYTTRIGKTIGYFAECMDEWFFKKISIGEKKVIGTPNVYRTDILKKYKYDTNCMYCDDSDLGERLAKDGHKQGVSSYWCYDIEKNDFAMIKKRWQMYAKSDIQYHNKYKKGWGLLRRVKSYLHSLTADWMGFNLYYLPFYVIIAFIRFTGRFYLKDK